MKKRTCLKEILKEKQKLKVNKTIKSRKQIKKVNRKINKWKQIKKGVNGKEINPKQLQLRSSMSLIKKQLKKLKNVFVLFFSREE